MAAQKGHAEIVNILLKSNADASISNFKGATAIIAATIKGQFEIVKNIYDHLSRVIRMPPKELQGFVNAKEKENGMTALRWACHEGYGEIAEYLIFTAKVDETIKDLEGKTALDLAREKEHTNIVTWLGAL